MGADLAEVEAGLHDIEGGTTPMHRSARHLLRLGGKRLRPLCVALAARVGAGFSEAVRDLAIAVELVHSATLLHDDVIDLGERRRGSDTARVIYGNAASIYAGDWLLVDALRRIQATQLPGLLERSLAVLNEILEAEAIQLKNRGNVRGTVADYFRVIEGKTASLFRWALYAGGRAGGVDSQQCAQLERYGQHLGIAFQVVDDVLDLAGDQAVVGKSLFADLREGKMTYPLLLAMERDPPLADQLAALCESGEITLDAGLERRISSLLWDADVVKDCLALARRSSDAAIAALAGLPPSRARAALEQIAVALVHRER
jgi:octaprenyl-diphosphate synthase